MEAAQVTKKDKITRCPNKEVNPSRQWRTHKLCQKPSLTLTGYSRAADKTFLHIPELKLGLDAGVCNGRQPEIVLLTHTHIDHSKDIGYMCQRDKGTTVYCPTKAVPFIQQSIRSEIFLNSCGEWDYEKVFPFKLIGCAGGDQFLIKNDTMRVTVVDCVHAVPCIGFCIEEQRAKLKAEYQKLSGKEIGALKKSGTEVSENTFTPLFVYLGDTSTEVFEKNPHLFDYPVIIVECTFFHQENGIHERAKRDGHVHWDSLKDIVISHPKITFVLIHFSLRYKESEIYQFFDELVSRPVDPLNLDNIVIFVGEHCSGSINN